MRRRSSSSSTSYTRFSNARNGRQRPVQRRPPTSTASSTRFGVREKNVARGSSVTRARPESPSRCLALSIRSRRRRTPPDTIAHRASMMAKASLHLARDPVMRALIRRHGPCGLARHAVKGVVPTRRACGRLGDDEIIARLTQIYGVGRWTVEMLLIFTLGRRDVLPVDDFGVREGFRVAYGRRARPTPKALRAYGERWKPYRSVAAWYLWRAANEARRVTT